MLVTQCLHEEQAYNMDCIVLHHVSFTCLCQVVASLVRLHDHGLAVH